jgi:LPXTG-motif cell wall-anchored protein
MTHGLALPPDQRSLRKLKIAAVLVVIAVLVLAQRLGLFQQFADPARVKQTLVQLGPWGYVAFVAAYAALQPFGVPGTVFIMAAPLIWPWPVAFGLSLTGTMAASVVGFSFARFVARDWVKAMIPARFQKYDDALVRRAFTTVFVLRLVFWMPPLLHAFFGVSKVRFSTHFWGSLAGYVLPLFLVSFFGERLFEVLKNAPAGVWIGLGVGAVGIGLGLWLLRRRRRKARIARTEEESRAARE